MRLTVCYAAWALGAMLPACAAFVDLGPERELVLDDDGTGGTDTGGSTASSTGAGGGGGEFGCADPSVVRWARRYGDGFRQGAGAVAHDAQGGVYVSGTFAGTLDLGGGPLQAVGSDDMYLARLDGDGEHRWSMRFGEIGQQPTPMVVSAPDGGVVLFREFVGTIDLGDGLRVADGPDGFVARYDDQGHLLWARTSGGAGRQTVWSVAFDPTGGVLYAIGSFEGQMTIGGESLSSAGETDAFLAKLDAATGEVLTALRFGGPIHDWGNAVAVDDEGRVAFGGEAHSPIDLGQGELPADPQAGAWLAVYDSGLSPLWTTVYGGPGKQDLQLLAFDSRFEELVAVGILQGTTDLGTGSLSEPSGTFVARIAAVSGVTSVARSITGFSSPRAVALDASGDVVVTGPFVGSVAFDDPLVAVGAQDGVVARLDTNLESRWALPVGSPEIDNLLGVALDPTGDLFVHGYFRGTVGLPGCGPLTSAGDADLLLMRLAP